jgi:hypothetical protein
VSDLDDFEIPNREPFDDDEIAALQALSAEIERGESIFHQAHCEAEIGKLTAQITRLRKAAAANPDHARLDRANEIIGNLEVELRGWRYQFLRSWKPTNGFRADGTLAGH